MRADRSTVAAILGLAALLLSPAVLAAQGVVRVTADDLECLPLEDNGVGWATVEGNTPATAVHLNFRRLHDMVEDLYWVEMHPAGEGRYWGIFPKSEDRVLDRHDLEEKRQAAEEEYRWARWWRQKQVSGDRDPNGDLDDDLIRERASLGKLLPREWLAEMSDEEFESWLEQLENEPAEYYVSVHDSATGRELARSKTRVVEVRESCRLDLNEEERGEAENLTVGETAHWQRGEQVFHWLCDGIVTRVNPNGTKRPDEVCRACVIVWWKRPQILAPAVAGCILGCPGDDRIVSRAVP